MAVSAPLQSAEGNRYVPAGFLTLDQIRNLVESIDVGDLGSAFFVNEKGEILTATKDAVMPGTDTSGETTAPDNEAAGKSGSSYGITQAGLKKEGTGIYDGLDGLIDGFNRMQEAVERRETRLTRANLSLQTKAAKDPLTDVLNRRAGLDKLEREMNKAGATGEYLTLTYADLNNLKFVNDTFGHQEGDEFILILTNCKKEQATHIWYRIAAEMATFNKTSGKPYSLSASYGIVQYDPDTMKTKEDFLEASDKLMYEIKMEQKGGRGRTLTS